MIQSPVSAGIVEAPRPQVVVSPRRDLEHAPDFEPFNPNTVSQEAFSVVPGEIQEFALKHLIRNGDRDSLIRLRPDMQWHRQPSAYEMSLTRAIHSYTSPEPPADYESSQGYTFIESFVAATEPNLANKLSSEKARRVEQPDFLFYSWEMIGGYDPAVRYRILLEDKVRVEIEEEQRAADEAKEESERRLAYDRNQARKDRERVAEIRAELISIQGGITDQAA
jgi:hypothetical protein